MPKKADIVYNGSTTGSATASIPVTFADADAYTLGLSRVSAGATVTVSIAWLVAGATVLTETLFNASTALATVTTAAKTAYTTDAMLSLTSTAAQTAKLVLYKKFQGA